MWRNCGTALAQHKHNFGTGSTRFSTIYTRFSQSLSAHWQINAIQRTMYRVSRIWKITVLLQKLQCNLWQDSPINKHFPRNNLNL